MAEIAGSRGAFQSRGVCIHPYADARTITRAVGATLAWILILASVARLVVPVLDPAGIFLVVPLGLLAALLAIVFALCLACAPLAWLWAAVGLWRSAALRVESALWVEQRGARTSFPLVSLTRARLSGQGGEVALRTDEGDVIRVRVAGAGEAQRLLDAIATASARGTWIARLYGDAPAWPGRGAFGGLAALVALLCWPFLDADVALSLGVVTGASAAALAALLRRPFQPDALAVGRDGVSLRGDGEERFIPFERIERVDETCLGVSLALTGGEALPLTLVPPQLLRDPAETGLSMMLAERRRDHLLGLLRDGAARRARADLGAAALLERSGRPLRVWRAAVRDLVRDAGADYRTAKLTKDQAREVLEDGRAPAELRIGAALALSARPDRETTRHLRIAVDTCASRDLRAALEQAAEGELDESTLQRALGATEG